MTTMTTTRPRVEVLLQAQGLIAASSDTVPFDLEVRRGERVALVGEDQVRLTQIIRIFGGIERPRAGVARVLGIDVASADRGGLAQARRQLGYVSVAGGLLSNMSIRANIEVAMRYHGDYDPATIRARSDALLAEVGLSAHAGDPASVIPAELQKCAAYVRAMARDPTILLIEDPTAFLHPEGRIVIQRIHERLAATQTTVVLADDDVAFAAHLADRAVWFDNGTVRFDGPFASLPSAAGVRCGESS